MSAEGADGPTKRGNVRQAEFEGEEFLRALEPVANALAEEVPAAKLDRKALAALSAQLQQFQEDALGINALPPKPFPKLPATLFRDLRSRGGLFHIASACARIQLARGLKKLDFTSPALRKQNIELLASVRRSLQTAGLLPPFRVALDPALGADALPRLQGIVSRLGGEAMPSADAPDVTHIVRPFGPDGDPDDGKQYMRSLESRGAQVRVHWWYYPDSYDEFIAASVAPPDPEPDKRNPGAWQVYLRWLTDSEKYNEWMNPADYETEAGAAAREAAEAAAKVAGNVTGEGKRKASDGSVSAAEPGAKRAKAGASKTKAPEVSAWSEDLGGGVVRQTVVTPHARAVDGTATAIDISHGQRPVETAGIPKAPVPARTTAAVPNGPPEQEAVALHRVPGHAAWFRHAVIHDVEKRQLPEFFDGKSQDRTPEVYKEWRDAIINKYREQPTARLTAEEACRLFAAANAAAVARVFTFLDAWGLINHLAPDGGAPAAAQPSFEISASGPPGEVRVLTAAPPAATGGGAAGMYAFHRVEGAAAQAAAARSSISAPLATRRDVLGSVIVTPSHTAQQRRIMCAAMPWVDCTACRYHCTKRPDIDLCPQAFAEGRFPAGTAARDFVRIDAPPAGTDKAGGGRTEWSDQETLLLLEGVEMHGEAWSAVAAHVGTKSALQCTMRFLQLPLEDNFVDAITEDAAALPGVQLPGKDTTTGAAATPQAHLPFSDANNPIMAQVAFLTAMVSPKIAAAAAKAALEALSEEDPALAEDVARESAAAAASLPTAAGGGAASSATDAASGGAIATAAGATGAAASGSAAAQTAASADPSSQPAPLQPDSQIGAGRMRVAAATALAAAAVKAKLMADAEEREIQLLVKQAVEAQVQKVRVKMGALAELETALQQERTLLQASHASLLQQRLKLQDAPLPVVSPAPATASTGQSLGSVQPQAVPGISLPPAIAAAAAAAVASQPATSAAAVTVNGQAPSLI